MYGHDINIQCFACFGDGNHETTRFLLYYLNKYVNGKTYIDSGSGSGILSVFASKKGAAKVTAIDNDKYAAECTIKNARKNEVDITVINDDIRNINIKAEIVTANFARLDVLELYPHLVEMVADGGLLITTWWKQIQEKPRVLKQIDIIEGVEYDALVLFKGDNNASN